MKTHNTMKAFKSLVLTAALICGGILTANAQLGGGQKIVYVDSEYIMENIPEYGDAQEELNALSTKWQKEVKAVYDKVSEMYSKYQTEMLLLSEDQKRAREQAIVDKEQEAKNLQMQYFGAEGQLYQKRTELINKAHEYNELPIDIDRLCVGVDKKERERMLEGSYHFAKLILWKDQQASVANYSPFANDILIGYTNVNQEIKFIQRDIE